MDLISAAREEKKHGDLPMSNAAQHVIGAGGSLVCLPSSGFRLTLDAAAGSR